MFNITALYLGLNGLIFAALSINVVRLRRKLSVSLGDGGHPELNRAIRAFGNLSEYLPVFILMLGSLELKDAPAFFLHSFGILFTIARILHPLALYEKAGKYNLYCRIAGAATTWCLLVISSLWLIFTFR